MKKTVREIMVTDVITAHPEDDIEAISQKMLDRGCSGLPVVDDAGKLVGIITEKDLVFKENKVALPLTVMFLDIQIWLESPRRFYEEVKKTAAQKVEELMTTKVHTTTPDTLVEDVATLMVRKDVNRIPVVDENNKLLGIVSRQDVIRASVQK